MDQHESDLLAQEVAHQGLAAMLHTARAIAREHTFHPTVTTRILNHALELVAGERHTDEDPQGEKEQRPPYIQRLLDSVDDLDEGPIYGLRLTGFEVKMAIWGVIELAHAQIAEKILHQIDTDNQDALLQEEIDSIADDVAAMAQQGHMERRATAAARSHWRLKELSNHTQDAPFHVRARLHGLMFDVFHHGLNVPSDRARVMANAYFPVTPADGDTG